MNREIMAGVDLGGTKILAGLFDDRDKCWARAYPH